MGVVMGVVICVYVSSRGQVGLCIRACKILTCVLALVGNIDQRWHLHIHTYNTTTSLIMKIVRQLVWPLSDARWDLKETN